MPSASSFSGPTTFDKRPNKPIPRASSSIGTTITEHEFSSLALIHQLSTELIAHIFARLDPISLTIVAKTCRHWRHIVMDDVCWKNAFVAYFGRLPYKRLQTSSWKSEYILRTHLIRKWEKGRGTLLTFNPKIGSIDDIQVDFEEDLMMAASKEQGIAVQCHPSTGKLNRDLIYSTDEGMPIQVGAFTMDNNRILWGFLPGYVTMTTRAKTLVRRQLRLFSDFHQGAVRALCLPSFVPDIVLTAGDDGLVKIWNVTLGISLIGLHGSTSSPTCLEATSDHHVIAGYANGTIVLWDIQILKLAQQRRQQLDHQQEMGTNDEDNTTWQRRLIHPPLIDKETSVRSIHYETITQTLLVTYDGVNKLYQYDIHSGRLLAVFGNDRFGHTLGPISAITWDIEPSFSFTDETVVADHSGTMNRRRTHHKSRNSQPGSSTTRQLVATGDTFGTICLWPLDKYCNTDELVVIHPLRQFHGHESPISAIHLDAFKLVSGTDDGWIRIWDPLTGELLHVLGNKIPRHAPINRLDVSLMRVKNIVCDEYRGVATIGHQVKSWDFSGRKRFGQKSKALSPSIRNELHYEIKEQVQSSAITLAEERRAKVLAAKEMDKWTLGGLSDEEMVAYAMMISQEPMDASPPSSLTDPPLNDDNDDDALLQAIMASLTMDETNTTSPMDFDLDWPTIGSSTTSSTHAHNVEDDEELQYVLELSRHDT
ncbi:WD40-repeat-containing domain protein [Chlamydoabsidia padenii]|nr:WD40-repeat-containing domain protein [Chlamydoabsidia padenii]